MPISNLSGTITKDIIGLLRAETEFFKSTYFPEENFYLLTFTGFNTTFCFDVRNTLPENGSYRVTRDPALVLLVMIVKQTARYRWFTWCWSLHRIFRQRRNLPFSVHKS